MTKKTTPANKTGSVVKPCPCKNSFQDTRYGVGQRLHNVGTKGITCTVCGNRKTV